jgi:hypothetical protein
MILDLQETSRRVKGIASLLTDVLFEVQAEKYIEFCI